MVVFHVPEKSVCFCFEGICTQVVNVEKLAKKQKSM